MPRAAGRTTVCALAAALAVVLTTAAPARASARVAPSERLPALTPSANDALGRALASGRLSDAEYALERATSLFRLRAVRSRFGDVERPEAHDATFLLRDLAARLSRLSGDERERGERILARPTDSKPEPVGEGYSVPSTASCTAYVCVHWVEGTVAEPSADAPPGSDGDLATVPPWVADTNTLLESIWVKQTVDYGYREPLDDSSSGQTDVPALDRPKLDVYLADVGTYGVYGYCATDDPNRDPAFRNPYYYDVSVYCVLDNDFADFGAAQTPEEFRDVTAAHEFFHAVQYAYDWLEDLWLMEGTAAWMEDEVYDDVDDNVRWLSRASSLARPEIPVDFGRRGFEYGAWIFWRYLSERFGRGVVRDVWERVDGSAAGRDNYSLQAVTRALAARSWKFRTVFGNFATANRLGRYQESGSYPRPPTQASYTLNRAWPRVGWREASLYHLTNSYFSFRPGTGVSGTAALRIVLDLPALQTQPLATIVVFRTDGTIRLHRPRLDAGGNGTIRVGFGRGRVRRVDLVLSNASTRFDCWWDEPFSCGGDALDDRRAYRFRAHLVR